MDDHFRALYSGTSFEYFLYDSAKRCQVLNFTTSAQIQIMVVTVGVISEKNVNNLYKDSGHTGGEKPINLIRATRPILIVRRRNLWSTAPAFSCNAIRDRLRGPRHGLDKLGASRVGVSGVGESSCT